MDKEELKRVYAEKFGVGAYRVYASPGRINLIGEHTDYNGGYVFPGAVEQGIVAVIGANGSNVVRAYSIDLNEYAEWSLEDKEGPKSTCMRFVYGIMRELLERGVSVKGFDCVFAGDVPLGAGMSSSAALESCFAYGLNDLFDGSLSRWEMVLAGQATEHKYIGCNCGVMDQFASVFGKRGQLMRLDCRSGEYAYYPFEPKGYRLVLVNSCVKHELAGSPYNDRRRSCERVVAAMQSLHPECKIETLRDAQMYKGTMYSVQGTIPGVSEEDMKRAKYVLEEEGRVLAVCDALTRGDYEEVGRQMYLTHAGLSHDYEVSCEELDFLNDIAKSCGVTGSRMMGGGFGGCTINLVKEELYDRFVSRVTEEFAKAYGHKPVIIDVVIGDGSRRIE